LSDYKLEKSKLKTRLGWFIKYQKEFVNRHYAFKEKWKAERELNRIKKFRSKIDGNQK